MWGAARRFAEKYRVDPAPAADEFAHATHITADRLAEMERAGKSGEILSQRRYIFGSYMYRVFRVATKQGAVVLQHVKPKALVSKSDEGNFMQAIENHILCMELLDAMPPKGKCVATARYILGLGWKETAESLESSINAAQKAQTVGFYRAFDFCRKGVRRMRQSKS